MHAGLRGHKGVIAAPATARRVQQGLQGGTLRLKLRAVPGGYVRRCNGAAEQVALDVVQPGGGEGPQLFGRLHAFNHHRQAQVPRQRADVPQQLLAAAVVWQLAYEQAVAFDARNGQLGQHAQR